MSVGITIVQIFICLGALITVGVLQSMAAAQIRSSSKYQTIPSVQQAFNYLVGGASLAFISVFLALGIIIAIFKNRDSLAEHMSKLVYAGIIIIGALLLTSGALGIRAAITLQCYLPTTGSDEISTAWNYSTATSLVGILGVFITLIVQFFVQTDCGSIRFQSPVTFGASTPVVDATKTVKAEMKSLEHLYY